MIKKLLCNDGVIDIDSNKRKVVYLSKNTNSIKRLKIYLNKINCFNFYSTNSGNNIIGLSQISYFIHTGYKAYLNGYTVSANEHEIHHLNGDVRDNCPTNLLLLCCDDHHLVTSFQRASVKQLTNFNMASLKSNWLSEFNNEIFTPFNNQGKSIRNHKHFLFNVIAKTILQTSQSKWLAKAIKREIPIAEVDKLVEKYNPNKYNSFYREQLLSETQRSLEEEFRKAERLIF